MLLPFFQWFYPRSCMGCGVERPQAFRFLCWECWSLVKRVELPYCDRCGDPVVGAVEHAYICYFCANRTIVYDRARSAVRYNGVIAEAIQELKYRWGFWLIPDLAEILYRLVVAEFSDVKYDVVLPIPLHIERRRRRGYNQSAFLARALAKRLEIAYAGRWLKRVKATPTQTHLTAAGRMSNVSSAFEVVQRDSVKGKSVLVVDDVITTGATVYACAKMLRKAGAKAVYVVSVARG